MSGVVHGLKPPGEFISADFGETACGSTWGVKRDGGLVPIGTARRRVIQATDFGEVTCQKCIRTMKGTVQ